MKILLTFTLLLLSLASFSQSFNPLVYYTGSDEKKDLEEDLFGTELGARLLGSSKLSTNKAQQVYINKVLFYLATKTTRPNLTWRAGIIESNDINAWALPGGIVFVTEGLIRLLENEAELAAVLAHEISHIEKKHHMDVYMEQQKISGVASFAQNVLLKNDNDENQKVLSQILGNGAELLARKLDKSSEYQADEMAVNLLLKSGYDPFALVSVLQKMERLKISPELTKLLYSTHPHPSERVEMLEKQMNSEKIINLTKFPSIPNRFAKNMYGDKK